MSVWTLIVERDRHQDTNFSKPWEKPKGYEAHVMYGSPDSNSAWKQAEEFLLQKHNLRAPEYRIIGIMKGNFGTNFYTQPNKE